MRKFSMVSMILAGLVLIFGQAQAAEPVNVGLCDVGSGPFKSNGDRFRQGIEIAIEEVNEAGGILGRPVVLKVEDNQMKPEIAVQKLKKLILNDECEAVFHGSSSAVGMAITQAIPRYKKLYVSIAAFAMGITGEHFNPYTFRTDANAAILAKTMAKYVGTQKQLKKVYLINQDYSYGHDIANMYEKFIKEVNPEAEIVGKDFHPVFNKDFAPYLSKVQAAGADYILTGNWGTDLTQLIVQARSLGMNIPFAAILMSDINANAAMSADQALGNYGVASIMPGIDSPAANKFEESFHSKAGAWPIEQIWQGYKAMKLYALAVNTAGSLDVQEVIKAFENLKWDLPTGTVYMRAQDHQLQQPMCVGQVVKKTKYFDFPYLKPLQVIPAEELSYDPAEYGWRPYTGK